MNNLYVFYKHVVITNELNLKIKCKTEICTNKYTNILFFCYDNKKKYFYLNFFITITVKVFPKLVAVTITNYLDLRNISSFKYYYKC